MSLPKHPKWHVAPLAPHPKFFHPSLTEMEVRPCYPLHIIHMFTEFTHTRATLPRHSNIAPAILFVLGMVALHESFQRTIDDRFVPEEHSCDGTQLQQFASNHEAQTFSRGFLRL